MKTIFVLFFSMFLFLNTFSQNSEFEIKSDSVTDYYMPSHNINKSNIKSLLSDKVHLSFQTGLSFYSCGKESVFEKWVAPAITYNFTQKFHFTIGTVATFSNPGFVNYNLSNEGVKTISTNKNTGQYFLYAQGSYLLNDNITVRGTILRQVPDNKINPSALSFGQVGVDLKITDGFSISADCRISKGYNASLLHNINEYNFPSFPVSGGFYNRTR